MKLSLPSIKKKSLFSFKFFRINIIWWASSFIFLNFLKAEINNLILYENTIFSKLFFSSNFEGSIEFISFLDGVLLNVDLLLFLFGSRLIIGDIEFFIKIESDCLSDIKFKSE